MDREDTLAAYAFIIFCFAIQTNDNRLIKRLISRNTYHISLGHLV